MTKDRTETSHSDEDEDVMFEDDEEDISDDEVKFPLITILKINQCTFVQY